MKTQSKIRRFIISTLLLLIGAGSAYAQPYPSRNWQPGYGNQGWNRSAPSYYRPPCTNRGGWYGTGVPNGLAWTLLGIGAAGILAGTTRTVSPMPATVVVQHPPPVVICNGVPCYCIGRNFYPVGETY